MPSAGLGGALGDNAFESSLDMEEVINSLLLLFVESLHIFKSLFSLSPGYGHVGSSYRTKATR